MRSFFTQAYQGQLTDKSDLDAVIFGDASVAPRHNPTLFGDGSSSYESNDVEGASASKNDPFADPAAAVPFVIVPAMDERALLRLRFLSHAGMSCFNPFFVSFRLMKMACLRMWMFGAWNFQLGILHELISIGTSFRTR